jgi:hypothetical protein
MIPIQRKHVPANDILRSAHRRVKAGAACFGAAILLFVLSAAVPTFQRFLSVAAAVLGVVSFGCFTASLLKWFAYRKELLVEKHPSQMRRLAFWAGALVMLLLSAYSLWLPIGAVIYGEATRIGRGAGQVSRAVDPTYFWVSVVFHGAIGLFLLGVAVYVIWKRWQSTGSSTPLGKDASKLE